MRDVTWCARFVMRLREAPRHGREVSFITNIDDVVSSCIEHVCYDSYHGYTSKSVFKYMHTRGVSGRTLQSLFWMTSNSYTMSKFEENLCHLTPDAREVLTNIGHTKWARAYFPNIRWNVVNIDVPHFFVLSVNQRNVLIIMLTEAIRDYIQRIIIMLTEAIPSLTTVLTPYVEMMLHKRMQKSVQWKTTKVPPEITSLIPPDIYRVFDFKKTCVVDLNRHTCSCGKRRSLGIACCHAIAVSRHLNIHKLPDMVNIYYRANVFRTQDLSHTNPTIYH
uniref:SWIM-type domain-containing protein n=1 Tax=Lactuca sativa TaxID=4236 RepID=A0A9R1XD17_LACSA|nr:hypothetical protein LSAT_V11C400161980 [Lactuca sativa]